MSTSWDPDMTRIRYVGPTFSGLSLAIHLPVESATAKSRPTLSMVTFMGAVESVTFSPGAVQPQITFGLSRWRTMWLPKTGLTRGSWEANCAITRRLIIAKSASVHGCVPSYSKFRIDDIPLYERGGSKRRQKYFVVICFHGWGDCCDGSGSL